MRRGSLASDHNPIAAGRGAGWLAVQWTNKGREGECRQCRDLGGWVVGLQTNIFQSVPLSCAEIQTNVERATCSYAGDCELLRLGLQAYRLGIAYANWPNLSLRPDRELPDLQLRRNQYGGGPDSRQVALLRHLGIYTAELISGARGVGARMRPMAGNGSPVAIRFGFTSMQNRS